MSDLVRPAPAVARMLAFVALGVAMADGASAQQAPQQPAQQAQPAPPAQQQRPARPAQRPAAATPAPAAPQLPAAPQQAQPNPDLPQPEWMKVCGKDDKSGAELCQTASFITAEAGNVVGEVRIFEVKQKNETKRVFEALIPPGFLIQPGVNLVIDDAKTPIAGRYRVCFPNMCLAEVPVSDDTLSKVKKGNQLTFFAANAQGQWVGAKVPLAGFAKALEGQPLETKAYEEKRRTFEESQNKLQAELVRRAEEQRRKLQEQTGAATPGGAPPAGSPAPAPAAAAAPAAGGAPKPQ